MVKVEDVARLAGVSVSTASRALRGNPAIPPETAARVRAAADRLNYVPHRAASNLRLQRSGTIVLFVNNLLSRQTSEFHDGVEAVCAENDTLLMLQKLDDNKERTARYIQLLREQRVDGVIVVPHYLGIYAEEIALMRRWGLTVVQIDNEIAGTGCDYVGCDNALGARLAAEHLLALGHRRFGIVASVSPLSCIQERIVSFREKAEEHGAEAVYVRAVGPKEDDRDFGRRAAHSLLDLPRRPTALFSTDAPGAVSILRGIRERGLRCPEDIAVATFDDDAYAPYLETPLTSVSWPAFEIGSEAARLLLKRVRGDESGPPQRILLPPALIHRESTLGARRRSDPGQSR